METSICPPEIKANNHTVYPFLFMVLALKDGIRKANISQVWGESLNVIHPNGQTIITEFSWAADQTPESYSHQVFIGYTNENTNRS